LDIYGVSPTLGLLSQFGSSVPALVPGQVIEAVVLALLEDGSVRLALPNATLDVRSTIPLFAGTSVRLLVKSTGSGLQLVVSPEDSARDSTTAAIAGKPGQTPDMVAAEAATVEDQAVNATMGASVEEQAVDISIQGANTTSQAATVERPATTQAGAGSVIANVVGTAAARQGGLAPLMADIEQLVGADAIEAPAAVLKAAAQLLGLRLPLQNGLTGADIKQALSQSGLFLEARLAVPYSEVEGSPATINRPGAAAPQVNSSAASTTPASPPNGANVPWSAPELASPVTDLKAALLVLRQVVQLWADQAGAEPNASSMAIDAANFSALVATASESAEGGLLAAPEPGFASPLVAATREAVATALAATATEPGTTLLVAASETATQTPDPAASASADAPLPPPSLPPPPPYRGSPPVAQPATAATLAAASSPADAAQRLLGATDAALARHTLLQAASLPDRPSADPARVQTQGPQWTFEVPVITSAGTSIAQFEISRDGRAVTTDGRAIWRARFSVDVEPMGPVHAQVTLLGNRAAVMLWAERPHSAAQLRERSGLLAEALKQADLEPGDIHCRTGAPTVPRESVPAAGQFLDRAS
jgi:Flagellar hook-length control protein FliK